MKSFKQREAASPAAPSSSSSWLHTRSRIVDPPPSTSLAPSRASVSLPLQSSSLSADRGSLRSPWSRRKKKRPLSRRRWHNLFMADGRLRDGGVKLLKKVRNRGVDPSIRADVWPYLLGVYELKSSEDERTNIRKKRRKDYERLRQRCQAIMDLRKKGCTLKTIDEIVIESCEEGTEPRCINYQDPQVSASVKELESLGSITDLFSDTQTNDFGPCIEAEPKNKVTCVDHDIIMEADSSDSESSEEESGSLRMSSEIRGMAELCTKYVRLSSVKWDSTKPKRTLEEFATWQRIIRLDALRVETDWIPYCPNQAAVSVEMALQCAEFVGLKDYDHLEPCMIYHAARLVAILEAYAIYDPEIGYCQGMSDLLSPIIAVMEEDHDAFWCFVGFMRKSRYNFQLDEVGIQRQLKLVSRIIKYKDSHLFRHLEKLQAADCFFVYRMVLVLFRRELTFEQTLCLWEVIWADQAAIRAGIGRSVRGKMKLRAPPTDDLLLFAIAACILQRRKLIIQNYSSMDEILRECNSMAGRLDVWRLVDDAHDLVMNLHDKI